MLLPIGRRSFPLNSLSSFTLLAGEYLVNESVARLLFPSHNDKLPSLSLLNILLTSPKIQNISHSLIYSGFYA